VQAAVAPVTEAPPEVVVPLPVVVAALGVEAVPVAVVELGDAPEDVCAVVPVVPPWEVADALVRVVTTVVVPQALTPTAQSTGSRQRTRRRIWVGFALDTAFSFPFSGRDERSGYRCPMERPPGADHGRRPRRRIDWELVACGWRGHVLNGLDAAEIRPVDAMIVREDGDVRWHRCLRCDSWVGLPAPEHPTQSHPPDRHEIVIPLRGRALRDRVVLRLIAIDRVIHFTILVLLGIVVLIVAANEHSLRASFYRVVTALQGGVGASPVQTTHVGILKDLNRVFSLKTGSLHAVGFALLAFGLLEGVEAIGLWLGRRWAEYLTFTATAVLLPLEIYELTEKVSALKVIGFLINLAVVVYLVYAKRLFGLRGGGAVDDAERAEALSWETIERATPPPSGVVSTE
jgi:uncharacterized membrane protein (DUF2068 family)